MPSPTILPEVKIKVSIEEIEKLKVAKQQAEDFQRRIQDDTTVKLKLNKAEFQVELDSMRSLLKTQLWDLKKIPIGADTSSLNREILITKANINGLTLEVTQAGRALTNYVRTGNENISVLGKQFDSVRSKIWEFGSSMKWMVSQFLTLAGAFTWLKAVFNITSQFEQIHNSLQVLIGDKHIADDLYGSLQQFAKKTPFNFKDVAQYSQQLLAMGFSANKVIPVMTALGNTAAALGGGNEKLGNIVNDIGVIQAKGKMQADNLRNLARNGVPIAEMLAEKFWKTKEQIYEMSKAGTLLSDKVLPAIFKAMNEKYGGMMEKQSQTLQGQLSNIKDSFQQTIATIGESSSGVWNAILWTLSKLTQWLSWFATTFPNVSAGIIALTSLFVILWWAVVFLWPIFAWVWTALVWLWWAFGVATVGATSFEVALALLTWPVGWIIWAISIVWVWLWVYSSASSTAKSATEDLTGKINEQKKSLEDLQKQQDANKKAYDDGTISQDDYKSKNKELQDQIDATTATMWEYQKWLDIIDNKHLTYIEKIKQINKLKLDRSAYDALIKATQDAQNEQIKLIKLQRLALNDKLAIWEQEVNDAKNAMPVMTGQGWIIWNTPTENQLIDLNFALDNQNKNTELQKARLKDAELGKQIDDILKEQAKWNALIKPTWWAPWVAWDDTGSGWSGGWKHKANTEALTKATKDLTEAHKKLDDATKTYDKTKDKLAVTEKKWTDVLTKGLDTVRNAMSKLKLDYDTMMEKIDADGKKKNDDTVSGQYRSLIEEKAKQEAIVKLSSDTVSAGNAGRDVDWVTAIQDQKKAQTALNEVNKQIDEIKKSGILDQGVMAKEDQRNSLDDLGKSRFDFQEKIWENALDTGTKKEDAKAKILADKKILDDENDIYTAFANKKMTTAGNLAKFMETMRAKYKDATDKNSALIDSLGKDASDLVGAKWDNKKALTAVQDAELQVTSLIAKNGKLLAQDKKYQDEKKKIDDEIAKYTIATMNQANTVAQSIYTANLARIQQMAREISTLSSSTMQSIAPKAPTPTVNAPVTNTTNQGGTIGTINVSNNVDSASLMRQLTNRLKIN